MREREAKHGDVIQTPNGNRYVVVDHPLDGRCQFFVGNADTERHLPTDVSMAERPDAPCEVVGKILIQEPWRP